MLLMSKLKVGIIGGAGYTAGELLRILIHHPAADIAFVQSESNAGKPLSAVHTDLFFVKDMIFCKETNLKADVIFLCKGHGESYKLLEGEKIYAEAKIIDLSQDFRLKDDYSTLQNKYGSFVYGLPELNRHIIKTSKNVANPGCFATCLQLGMLPLFSKHLIQNDVHISAITGSTGAGQKLTSTSHFSWRNNNMSVYKAFTHQHLKEVTQSLIQLDPSFDNSLFFIPYRGNFTRGIIATLYVKSEEPVEKAREYFTAYYEDHPFVHVSDKNIDLKQVVNTNYCQLFVDKYEDTLMIISTIDNLIKGASGQAVQNMNLMFGLKESMGLDLKSTAF